MTDDPLVTEVELHRGVESGPPPLKQIDELEGLRDGDGEVFEWALREMLVAPQVHTPAPWAASGREVVDYNGEVVCQARSEMVAELIVKAVNEFNYETHLTDRKSAGLQ